MKNGHDYDHSLPNKAIDTLERIEGRFPGARRAHAKGDIYEAIFSPNGNAIPYTTAAHLQNDAVPVTVRFSNSSPNPTAADFLYPSKGMAIQFHLPDGATSHLISTTIPIFPTKDPKSFIDMIKIGTADTTGIKPVDVGLAVFKLLIKKYPESKDVLRALKEQAKQPPSSYATLHYYPIHAFYFVNKEGNRRAIKYEWQPAHVKTQSTKLKTLSPDYLSKDLQRRLVEGPIYFDLIIRLGEIGDDPDDPTNPWPKDRKQITIGQLSITNKQTPSKDLLFDPTIVSNGIELTNDPILHFRHDAYAVSFERRSKESTEIPRSEK